MDSETVPILTALFAILVVVLLIAVSRRGKPEAFSDAHAPMHAPEYPRETPLKTFNPRLLNADPLITGKLYSPSRSAGMMVMPAEVPPPLVDILTPYGPSEVYSGGIPAKWQLPSIPITVDDPKGADHYDPFSGAARISGAPVSVQMPDHEPLRN